jgi:hypothetical protein
VVGATPSFGRLTSLGGSFFSSLYFAASGLSFASSLYFAAGGLSFASSLATGFCCFASFSL